MEHIRVGIVGCGRIAFSKHMPSLAKIPEVEMSAFCHPDLAVAQRAAMMFGSPQAVVVTDYRDLVRDPQVDVVHVCTPNSSHAEISVAALSAGKDVMCEKPMARNTREAQAMMDAAEKSGKKLTISFTNRFRRDSQYLFDACRRAELGHIYHAKAHAVRRRGVPTWGHFLEAEVQGGGALVDIGTHALDLTLWLMDNYEPHEVTGVTYNHLGRMGSLANPFGNWNGDNFEVEDAAFGLIVMKNGASIAIDASWALNTRVPMEAQCSLFGTLAGADMHEGIRINGEHHGKLFVTSVDTDPKGVNFNDVISSQSPHDLEMRRWIESIIHDTSPCVLPQQAYIVTAVVEALYLSASNGAPVYL
ncbi:MAG: oxidoreductase [Sulfobacillus benefaciens]|uniref:Oxidoreductase n=1 Tax=Sulfobacillus benefaciens TaxID=453960 RepID=A0A2T2X8D8_9FIRM|nr:MAG: oxidoreductase [Sulfobacillus benefaciens]